MAAAALAVVVDWGPVVGAVCDEAFAEEVLALDIDVSNLFFMWVVCV